MFSYPTLPYRDCVDHGQSDRLIDVCTLPPLLCSPRLSRVERSHAREQPNDKAACSLQLVDFVLRTRCALALVCLRRRLGKDRAKEALPRAIQNTRQRGQRGNYRTEEQFKPEASDTFINAFILLAVLRGTKTTFSTTPLHVPAKKASSFKNASRTRPTCPDLACLLEERHTHPSPQGPPKIPHQITPTLDRDPSILTGPPRWRRPRQAWRCPSRPSPSTLPEHLRPPKTRQSHRQTG